MSTVKSTPLRLVRHGPPGPHAANFRWTAESHARLVASESTVDADAAEVLVPVGGTVSTGLGLSHGLSQVSTNVWLESPSILWLAADHPWVVCATFPQAGFKTDEQSTVHLYPASGPTSRVVHRKSCSNVGGLGRIVLDKPVSGAPKVAWARARPGEPLTLLTYHGDQRIVTPAALLRYEDVIMPLDQGEITFRGGAYTANTQAGDCGAPIIGKSGVVGVHAAGGVSSNAFIMPQLVSQAKLKVSLVPPRPRRSSVASAATGVSRGTRGSARPSTAGKRRPEGRSKTSKTRRPGESIVELQASPSDYLGTPASYTKNASGLIDSYVEMIINPWTSRAVRLPDHVLAPTATYKMLANRTYTVPALVGSQNTLVFACHSRLQDYSAASAVIGGVSYTQAPLSIGNVAGATTAGPQAPGPAQLGSATASTVYDYTPGNILTPMLYDSTTSNGAFASLAAPAVAFQGGVWSDDYGTEQTSLTSWTTAYRALALAMRVRIVGLPVGQFMAPGKIYFAQVRYDSEDVPVTEQDYVQLERLGRASHVSLDAVRASGSKTFFATPDGPEKFEMTQEFLPAAGVYVQHAYAGTPADPPPPAPASVPTYVVDSVAQRLFPAASRALSQGGTGPEKYITLANVICPYTTETFTNLNYPSQVGGGTPFLYTASTDPIDQPVAVGTYVLIAAVFGVVAGTVIEVDYATCGEYLPDKRAPAGIDTAIQLPNSLALDSIFAAAAYAAASKGAMVQVAGDMSLSASPSTGRTSEGIRRVREGARRAAGGSMAMASKRPGESWWDTLTDTVSGAAHGFVSGGPLGALVGGAGGLMGLSAQQRGNLGDIAQTARAGRGSRR